MNRRHFSQFGARCAGAFGLGMCDASLFAEGVSELTSGKASILWVRGHGCSKCLSSLLDNNPLTSEQFFGHYSSLSLLSEMTSRMEECAMQSLEHLSSLENYIVVVEGTLSATSNSTFIPDRILSPLIQAIKRASLVMGVGSCASCGCSASFQNKTPSFPRLDEFLKTKEIHIPLVLVPGCPPHPDWILGTLVHCLKKGVPRLDNDHRPVAFFEKSAVNPHDRHSSFVEIITPQDESKEVCLF